MKPTDTCPDPSRWERFLADQVDDRECNDLEAHLDACETCRDRLALLAEWPSVAEVTAKPDQDPSQSWLDRLERIDGWEASDADREPATLPTLPGFDELEELGRGGMGIVYRARQVGLDRSVAIKVLSSAGRLAPKARSRAFREARALARLNHPNIVKVHDISEFDGLPSIVMEWVEGGDLSHRLEHGPLPPREAAELARTLALALAAAHEQGIIHRDIKPRNVLLAADGSPRLTDFGLAREVDSNDRLTSTGLAIGTPGYMAPEQIDTTLGPVGPPADIYALGATLYAMLTGRPPFQAANEAESLRQVVECDPVPPRRLDDVIPRDLDTICRTCLEKRPERRYASADDLTADLKRFLDGLPIKARPIGPVRSMIRRARRHPKQAALVCSVAILLLTMAVGGLLVAREQARLRSIAEDRRLLAVERENDARASADHARRVLQVMAEGMGASAKAIRTMNASSQPELRRISSKHLAEVTSTYARYFQEHSAETPWIASEVQMLETLAELRGLEGDLDEADRLRRRCIEEGMIVLERAPDDIAFRQSLVESATRLALASETQNGPEAAMPDFEAAYRLARVIAPEDVSNTDQFFVRAMAATNLAGTYHRLGHYEKAATVQAEALAFSRDVLARQPDDTAVTAFVIDHLCGLATTRIEQGASEEASRLLLEADAMLDTLRDAGPTSPGRDPEILRAWINEERERLPKSLAGR
ncbi:serine/threonine-protein kinase [Tautonia marina]|uniref:serine/threonine-protein kinase n=1 Tax=Tautonia marina TaxID=2653855 RepID=UPI00137626D1|nr:serine/threonine-protein kinase [Tautonia marina]